MSTATLPPRTAARPSRPGQAPRPRPGAGDSSAVGVFLIRYAGTLLPLAAALAALQIGGQLLADGAGTPGRGWPVAVAAAGGWALAVAVWLRRHGWTANLATVIAGPVAVLAAPAAAGWLSPAGLLLWGPVSTVLAVALVLAAQPLPPAAPRPTEPAATRA